MSNTDNGHKTLALGSKFTQTYLFITETLGPSVDNLWDICTFLVGGYTNIDTLVPEHVKMLVFKANIKL